MYAHECDLSSKETQPKMPLLRKISNIFIFWNSYSFFSVLNNIWDMIIRFCLFLGFSFSATKLYLVSFSFSTNVQIRVSSHLSGIILFNPHSDFSR